MSYYSEYRSSRYWSIVVSTALGDSLSFTVERVFKTPSVLFTNILGAHTVLADTKDFANEVDRVLHGIAGGAFKDVVKY
jgi:hypothetical protein